MTKMIDLIQRESCFQPGSSLCTGCMESVAFQNLGKVTDDGRKTVFAFGTFCGEVSTLQFPDTVAWGRGEGVPTEWSKSFAIMHHVFESAPTVAEAVRDTADLLGEMGALSGEVNVASFSGDGGALAIGLRTLLHTIHRQTRIAIFVLVNEIFANTGFQYSPATPLGADTSTTPIGEGAVVGNWTPPLDYLSLCVAAGAGLVAQVSPAFPKFFMQVSEKAMNCAGTSVVFIPAPCITGWKYKEGKTILLGRLGCETGFFPCFIKEKGKKAEVKFVEPDPANRPLIEDFMGQQRRFQHLVDKDKESGHYRPRPDREETLSQIRTWIQSRLDKLASL